MYSTFSAYLFMLTSTAAGYALPNPSGKYNVTLNIGTLTDYTRNDPSVANPTPRTLVLSVFQPAECTSTILVPYMPNKTAKLQGPYIQKQFDIPFDFTPLFLEARLPVCPGEPQGCASLDNDQIILFSGGWNIPRLYYSFIASAIASEGFTVITIDHPGDTNIITYPDGHSVVGDGPRDPTDDEFAKYTQARAVDASFVVDQLSNASAVAELLPIRGPRPFSTERIGMMGHSLGGAASILAASQDSRIRAAIDIDGSAFFDGPSPPEINAPVMIIAEDLGNATDPTWEALWPKLNGPKLEIEVLNTTHMSFSDALVLIEAAGQDSSAFGSVLGRVAPAEIVEIIVTYATTWMKGAFAGKVGGPLLDGEESSRFADVRVVKKGNY